MKRLLYQVFIQEWGCDPVNIFTAYANKINAQQMIKKDITQFIKEVWLASTLMREKMCIFISKTLISNYKNMINIFIICTFIFLLLFSLSTENKIIATFEISSFFVKIPPQTPNTSLCFTDKPRKNSNKKP